MPPDAPTISRLIKTRTVDLVTIGRRSGRPTRVEIWWFYFEGRFIITGTPGPRDWYANVHQNPRVVIETRHGHFPASASTISDRMFRRRFFSDGAARWYSTQAELDALVETAPMIEIALD